MSIAFIYHSFSLQKFYIYIYITNTQLKDTQGRISELENPLRNILTREKKWNTLFLTLVLSLGKATYPFNCGLSFHL